MKMGTPIFHDTGIIRLNSNLIPTKFSGYKLPLQYHFVLTLFYCSALISSLEGRTLLDACTPPSELDGRGSHLSTCSIPVESRILTFRKSIFDFARLDCALMCCFNLSRTIIIYSGSYDLISTDLAHTSIKSRILQNLDCGPWTGPWTGLWTVIWTSLSQYCARAVLQLL